LHTYYMNTKILFIVVAILFSIITLVGDSRAQFNSGSTGADGALDLTTCTTPCYVQLPESGILNYSTINVPWGKSLWFRPNSRNTPVTLLAQGTVTIAGSINVSIPGPYVANSFPNKVPGPGGYYGGDPGRNGFGPGGGTVPTDLEGKWVGPLSLVPIVGGSGGASNGCGGGGAIVIASSVSITIPGSGDISANTWGGFACNSGSGGAIRLVSNTLTVSGGLSACNPSIGGRCGVIRLEATNLSFSGVSQPPAVLSPINPAIISSSQPILSIGSVGGYTVPSYAGSRFDTADILLPNQLTDPINVVVQAVNIPSGTPVQVGFVNGGASATSTSCNLTGGPGGLSCIATISNLNRSGVTYLLATATFAPSAPIAQFNPKGPDRVANLRLESTLGAKPKYVFLRADNTVIDPSKLPRLFLQQFGM
jgi:hypothetical protein